MERGASSKTKHDVTHDKHDFISNMPDEILSYILSHLSTKEAIRSSVLSKRWEYLWTSITRLEIEDIHLRDNQKEKSKRIINFLNRVFSKLSGVLDIFSLDLSTSYTTNEILSDPLSSWISSALNLNVKKLCVKYCPYKLYHFAIPLLQSSSLVHLDLNIYCNVVVSPSSFKKLKVLKLCNIRFSEGCLLTNPKEMVLNLPVLEYFESVFCKWLSVESVVINAPLVESFALVFPLGDDNQPWSPTFKVFAPNLKKFHYSGMLIEDVVLSNTSSVVYACVDIRHNRLKAFKFLEGFKHVNCLKLSSYTMMVLSYDNNFESTFPVFKNLVHLELELNSSFPSEKLLLCLLHKSPNVKSIELVSELTNFDQDLLILENLPHCLLHGLKAVSVNCFGWNFSNLFLIKYFLENAKLLEKLTIVVPKGVKEVKRIIKEELQFSNASSLALVQVEKTTEMRLLYYRNSFYCP